MASGSSTDLSKGSCMRYLLKKLPIIILLQYAFAAYHGKSFDWLCVVLHLNAFLFLTEEYRSNVSKCPLGSLYAERSLTMLETRGMHQTKLCPIVYLFSCTMLFQLCGFSQFVFLENSIMAVKDGNMWYLKEKLGTAKYVCRRCIVVPLLLSLRSLEVELADNLVSLLGFSLMLLTSCLA